MISILREAVLGNSIDGPQNGGTRSKTKFAYVPNRIYICHSAREKAREIVVGRELRRVCGDAEELSRLWESFRPDLGEGEDAS